MNKRKQIEKNYSGVQHKYDMLIFDEIIKDIKRTTKAQLRAIKNEKKRLRKLLESKNND